MHTAFTKVGPIKTNDMGGASLRPTKAVEGGSLLVALLRHGIVNLLDSMGNLIGIGKQTTQAERHDVREVCHVQRR